MKSGILDKQRTIQAKSDVFQIIQLTKNISTYDNSIFPELLYKSILVNYIDDFVISTKTKKELEEKTI